MRFIDTSELPAEIACLLDDVARGEEFTIWHDGKPVMLLLPLEGSPKPDEAAVDLP